jgi:anti-sigma factor RsiW
MLSCKELIESLTDYIEGRLSLPRKAAFQLHLLCCGQCRDYLHNYETTIAASKQAFPDTDEEAAPAEVPEDLIQAILKARQDS